MTWTPIEARGWNGTANTLTITGASTADGKNTYAVLKNMTVEAATGNGGFISESGSDDSVTANPQTVIQYLGFENANVSAPNGYASVVVGEAYNTTIQYVYVNNSQDTASVTGSKVGVMAGILKNAFGNLNIFKGCTFIKSIFTDSIHTLRQTDIDRGYKVKTVAVNLCYFV